jgi:hypothetical protein
MENLNTKVVNSLLVYSQIFMREVKVITLSSTVKLV